MILNQKIIQTVRALSIPLLVITVIFFFGFFLFINKNASKKTRATNDEGISVSLKLSKQMVKKNEEVTAIINASSSAEMRIVGYLGSLIFDKSKFQVKNIQYKLGVVSKDLGDENTTISAVNQAGKVYLQGEIQSSQGHIFSRQAEIASITFIASEEAKIQLNFNDIKFYRINADNTLTDLISDNVDSDEQSNTVSLKVNLKLQGFVPRTGAQAKQVNVKVKLGGGGLATPTEYQTVVFSSAQEGIWTGIVNFEAVPPGSNYYLLIKGEKHVQRKICDIAPTETDTERYQCVEENLSFVAGENILDLTGILQFVGDLNLETGQDGEVNSADLSVIYAAIKSKVPIDSVTLERGDVNFDGTVDSQDYSLIIKTMELSMNKDE